MLGEIVPSGSESRTSMLESAMREGERWAESEDHLRSSAAKPAVLPIRNSRRAFVSLMVRSKIFEDGLQNRGRKQRKNAYRAGGKPVQLRIVYLRLFIRRSRTSAYGSRGLSGISTVD